MKKPTQEQEMWLKESNSIIDDNEYELHRLEKQSEKITTRINELKKRISGYKEIVKKYTDDNSIDFVRIPLPLTAPQIGICKIIEEIINKNSNITKEQISNELRNRRFDFKGKDPTKSINIAVIHLKYSKKAKP